MPRSINENVPENVERVLLKALAKERSDRYADVPSMVKAFKDAWISAGIPMQGTAVTLPAVTSKEARTAEPAQAIEAGKAAVAKEPKKKRSPWPFVAAGVFMIFCCVFAFLATRPNRGGFFPKPTPTSPPTRVVEVPSEVVRTPVKPEPQPPGQGDMPPAVQEAQRNADAHPDDPFARLNLALAYWDASMQRSAYETLNRAAELAGEDKGFLVEAGNQFHKRQAWIASAAMYLRFIKQTGPGEKVPDEILNNFHEAVYKAAPLSELEVTYPLIDEVLKVDQPIGLVAQSRHAYYNGRLDDGRLFLNQVKHLKPGFLEASLLEAEYAMIENRHEEAKLILQPLVADLGAPQWIRIMAEDFLNRIP
jgi:hypothetical protein